MCFTLLCILCIVFYSFSFFFSSLMSSFTIITIIIIIIIMFYGHLLSEIKFDWLIDWLSYRIVSYLPKIIKIIPCLSKLQLAEVGTFFETQCIFAMFRHTSKLTATVRPDVCPVPYYRLRRLARRVNRRRSDVGKHRVAGS